MNEHEIKAGWRVVASIVGGMLLLNVLAFVVTAVQGQSIQPRAALRLLLTAWLLWQTYQGRNWARYVLSALLLLSGLSMLLLGFQATGLGGVQAIFFLFGVFYLGGGLSLLAAPQVSAYFRYAGG